MQRVLITGGTGLVGMRLSELLTDRGYDVAHLSHSASGSSAYVTYQWDIDKGTIDGAAIDGSDFIIHLAGANLADGEWTKKRKQTIIDSRVKSAELLANYMKDHQHHVKAFISSSAIGYYGNRADHIMDEESSKGTGFLPDVCEAWEEAANLIGRMDIRVAILRTGVVLSTRGGALPELEKPLKFHLGAYIGSGNQYYSWVHIDDLCNMYIKVLEDDTMNGIFNAVAPNPVRNKELIIAIEKVKNIVAINAPSPELVLRLAMGEMADMILDSTRVSSLKIEERAFNFQFSWIEDALKDLYKRKV